MAGFDIKQAIRKLEVLRRYSGLVVPIVIAVISIAFLVASPLMGSKLRQTISSQSVSKYKQIESLSRNAPCGEQWKVEEDYQQAYANDANQMLAMLEHTTQRELLSYNIFPEPQSTSPLVFDEFGKNYQDGIEALLARINAGRCPSKAELEQSVEALSISSGARTGGRGSGFGPNPAGPFGQGEVSDRSEDAKKTIQEALCRQRAASARVYCSPADLAGYLYWGKDEQSSDVTTYEYVARDAAMQDCWFWQLGYWVIGDIIDTVDVLNSGSESVFSSPVKRILYVSFGAGQGAAVRSTEEPKVGQERPKYVTLGGGELTEFFTRRICSNDVDVIHFDVSVLLSAESVMPFMKELCSARKHRFRGFDGKGEELTFEHNQITVLESSIRPINPDDAAHKSYRYGGRDVMVQLDLVCEYVFVKSGYEQIKPEQVKKDLTSEQEL